MAVRIFGWVAALMLLASCTSGGYPNLQWAKENNIPYFVIKMSEEEWTERMNTDESWRKVLTDENRAPGDILCLTETDADPPRIYVRDGTYKRGWFGDVLIKGFNEDCLEEEVGHIREAREKVPPHSKYSRERLPVLFMSR